MKFLWLNNVSNICGGTLACTLSMIQSLPDAKHTVFSFNRFGPQEYEAFPQGIELSSGSNIRDFIGTTEYDVVVYQNTGFEQMPSTFPNRPLKVYYQHSNHRSAKQCREKCDITFCVSEYLAGLAGLSKEHVLYQPVTVPPITDAETHDSWSKWAEPFDCVIGRLCSPNPSKWKQEDVIDIVDHVTSHYPHGTIGWHFVGCPDWIRKEIGPGSNFYFSDTSFRARSFLHKWDYLLYKSSLPETYGRVVKEAQRCRCIPIVSNLGGFKEQINHGVSGYLCDSNEEFLYAVMDEKKVNRNVMQRIGNETGSCRTFREEFLRRLNDHCSR